MISERKLFEPKFQDYDYYYDDSTSRQLQIDTSVDASFTEKVRTYVPNFESIKKLLKKIVLFIYVDQFSLGFSCHSNARSHWTILCVFKIRSSRSAITNQLTAINIRKHANATLFTAKFSFKFIYNSINDIKFVRIISSSRINV